MSSRDSQEAAARDPKSADAMGIVIVGGAAGSKIAYDNFVASEVRVLGFMDNHVDEGGWGDFSPALLGPTEHARNQAILRRSEVEYFVATGDNRERARLTEHLRLLTGKPPTNSVHPRAIVSSLARIGVGNMINAGAIISAFARVGDGVIVNTGAIIEHDNSVGDYAQISPGAVLAGYVTVGRYAFVGSGASVIPHVTIGEGAIVGAGAAVIRTVEPNTLVVGVPAAVKRRFQTNVRGNGG